MNNFDFGNRIYELRTDKGLTQGDVARSLGISDKAISKWENSTSKPTINNLQKLADLFDITLEELLNTSKKIEVTKITKIVITGGHLSGKTSVIEVVKDHFEKIKYKVIIVPDIISIFKDSGYTDQENIEQLLKSRLEFEEMYEELINSTKADKILVLYDGASLDLRSLSTKRAFINICNNLNISEEEIRNSYDAVFHLKSTAKWDTNLYDRLNTNKNIDSSLAITLDDKIISTWIPHSNYRIIDCCISVDDKARKLINEISKFINEDEHFYIEKKYLIKTPDIKRLDNLGECSKVKMTLTYLKDSNESCDVKLLLRDEDGKKFYQKITKGNNKKTTIYLTADEYIEELNNKDKERNQLSKYRYSFVYNSTYYKIDIFEDKELSILEVDLLNDYDKVLFPRFVEIIKDVSNDSNYKNYNICKK